MAQTSAAASMVTDAPAAGTNAPNTCCWVCAYQGEPLGAKLSNFIVKHVGIMDMHCIAQQVSDFLLLHQPTAKGADAVTIYEHISRHMLHPRVRLAVTLRQLLDFLALLQNNLVVDDGTGTCAVDKSNAELYLKVIQQVLTLYKVEVTGLLFTDEVEKAGDKI